LIYASTILSLFKALPRPHLSCFEEGIKRTLKRNVFTLILSFSQSDACGNDWVEK
jgi:hypothetical protein